MSIDSRRVEETELTQLTENKVDEFGFATKRKYCNN